MSSHLIATTGLLIGVVEMFVILLTIMAVSLKQTNLFLFILMYVQHWTLLEHVWTDSKQCGGDGLLNSKINLLKHQNACAARMI